MEDTAPTALAAVAMRRGRREHRRVFEDCWALTKPEVNLLVAITAAAGFCLGRPDDGHGLRWLLLLHTVVGTWFVASGAGALNQFMERRFDALMRRTALRPLAAARMAPGAALWFGVALSGIGTTYLALAVNALASLLAVVTLVTYLFLYTPLKRKTPLCMLAGALPGAMPPLIGWAASSGTLGSEAWELYAVVFFWQFPHVMAIAWMYRDDYAKAGYLVLPRERPERFLARQIVLPSLVLIPLTLIPLVLRQVDLIYIVGAALLSFSFACCGIMLVLHRSNLFARRLLFASIVYLPLAFGLMVLARV
jgi:protoheme IX farnesyltransferase